MSLDLNCMAAMPMCMCGSLTRPGRGMLWPR